MINNKKQEIIERFDKEFNGKFTFDENPGHQIDYFLVLTWLEKAIDEIYDDIEKSLPKDKVSNGNDKIDDTIEKIGFNECLSQVKQIIKSKKI